MKVGKVLFCGVLGVLISCGLTLLCGAAAMHGDLLLNVMMGAAMLGFGIGAFIGTN